MLCFLLVATNLVGFWEHNIQGHGNRRAWVYSYAPRVELGARVDVAASLYPPSGFAWLVFYQFWNFCASLKGLMLNLMYWQFRGGARAASAFETPVYM